MNVGHEKFGVKEYLYISIYIYTRSGQAGQRAGAKQYPAAPNNSLRKVTASYLKRCINIYMNGHKHQLDQAQTRLWLLQKCSLHCVRCTFQCTKRQKGPALHICRFRKDAPNWCGNTITFHDQAAGRLGFWPHHHFGQFKDHSLRIQYKYKFLPKQDAWSAKDM